MLKLDNYLKLDKKTLLAPNLCDRFSDADLDRIGSECLAGYKRDDASRRDWLRRNEAGMDLALQIQKDKTFPWPGCSAVAFPLVTVAAMQFHARAYPSIVNGPELVKYRVLGADKDGARALHAAKISTHMSYQLLEEDKAWEEQQDRLLLNLSIIGTCFKKTYYSAAHGHNISEMVLAKDLVLNYWAKSVEDCERKTHIIPMFRNEIHEKVLRGTFRDVLESAWYQAPPPAVINQQQIAADRREGLTPSQPDEASAFLILEQHCSLDLDDDGYAEPYVITLEPNTGEVLRIVTRFEEESAIERISSGRYSGKIVKIRPTEYFTKYSFIPSPDGGVYDIGFGVFLGPLNESVNALVNQLIDSGTMSNTAGGFLGRGAKIRGGVYQFSPFGWNRVDSTGDDLRKSVFPLPVREPSMVLFQLLSLLIQYTNRVAGTTETLVGENPGQNTPAATTQSMIEMGQKIYAAIFKRIWRSEKEEFKKLYILNSKYLPAVGLLANREDYQLSPDDCVPSADPNITSDFMNLSQAQAIRAAASEVPGYNRDEVERRFLRALKVENVDVIYPGVPKDAPPPPDAKLLAVQVKAQALELEKLTFAASLQEEQRLNTAKITELMAQASLAMEKAGGIKEGHRIAAFQTEVAAAKQHNDALHKKADLLLRGMEQDDRRRELGSVAGPSGDESSEEMGTDTAGGADGDVG